MAWDGGERREEGIAKRRGKLEGDGVVHYVDCGNDCTSVSMSDFNCILQICIV